MNVTDLPIIRQVVESGADDRVYDALVLVGPLVVVGILLLGRNAATVGLAALYVTLFVSYLAYRGVTGGDR
jgi:hypothetical protein